MPETMTINVTQQDIDAGKPGDNCKCPIALAFIRAFGWVPDDDHLIDVFYTTAHVLDGHPRQVSGVWELPGEATLFIRTFDHPDDRENVQPFTFEAVRYI
jgi:hypothetical protein